MQFWKTLLTTLAFLHTWAPAFAEHTTYNPATGLASIPAVRVGAETYVNVTLQLVPRSVGPTFELLGATLASQGRAASANYDASTGVLDLPIVKIGNAAYKARLTNQGGYVFALGSADPLPPTIVIDPSPAAGASLIRGQVYGVDPSRYKVVLWALTNLYYVQPFTFAPFTAILPDGSWGAETHPWNQIVALIVDPLVYSPPPATIAHPSLAPGVLAWTEYPSPGPATIQFSGRTWGIKVTGRASPDQRFDPGPNYWSNDPSVVSVAADRLHLRIRNIGGQWVCGEVYLLDSLGFGKYTVKVNSRLDQLDRNTVAAPLFVYTSTAEELDNEYSGPGGLIPAPQNAQYAAQPYTTPGNINRYVHPSVDQFTTQIEWRADRVVFRSWKGWANVPGAGDVIKEWTYTGPNIPVRGPERVHINLWLLSGAAPASGLGDELVIEGFTFEP